MRPFARSMVVAFAVLAAPAACSDQAPLNAPLPPAGILTGRFGGRLLEITAADTAALFRFACASGTTTPLRVSIEGQLEAFGNVLSGWPPGATYPMDVTAALRGYLLDVTVTIHNGASRSTSIYLLRRNTPGDFSGIACAL